MLFSKWIWKNLSERKVYVNVTYDCCSQSEYEKTWVRGMFMWMLLSMKTLSDRNVYVNVTYECCSQSEYEKTWVRGMFM
jgi:hypothetical protein